MKRKTILSCLSMLLVLAMTAGIVSPMTVYATGIEDTKAEEDILTDNKTYDDTSEELAVEDYDTFYNNLLILEEYAEEYVVANSKENKIELVVNFIRTGVERYNDSNWKTLAGEPKTAFINYVAEQDAAKGTNATILRNLEYFKVPNGANVDFGHMFGALNIAIKAGAEHGADLGGWAGDLCDLLEYSKNQGVEGTTIDEQADYIREELLGVEAKSAFGMVDIYGDLDAYYIKENVKKGKSLSEIFKGYFTAEQTDEGRAVYFLNNRFAGKLTKEDVREAMHSEYAANVGISVLEADRGLTDEVDLRKAVCYSFADYLFALADGKLVAPEEPEEPIQPDEPKDDEDDKPVLEDNKYYSVFSSTSSTLAPGIEQTIKYAYTADDKQIAYYLANVDVNREDVSIHANYKNHDGSVWGMSRVVDQMAAAQAKHTNPEDPENYIENFNTIVGVNADFFNMSNGAPSGALVMDGVEYHGVGSENFFAILKDGTPVIGAPSEWSKYAGQVQEAVGGSIFLVQNGESVVQPSSTYYNSRASRTCIGIKENNEVVLMVLDGRQEPFSAGGSAEEIAQIMVDAGCVTAINLDGGGSTTFAAKPEGSDEVTIVNRPSDGYARSVSSSLVVVSTAKVSKEFDHANIITKADYLTIGSELELNAVGVSGSGNAAPIPNGTEWKVSDDSIGIIKDGVFTATENGTVEIQLVHNGEVVGRKEVYVVIPDGIRFEKNSLNAIFGEPTPLPLTTTYNGNPVVFNPDDIYFYIDNEEIGYIDGLDFIGDPEAGIRGTTIYAFIDKNDEMEASIKVSLYNEGEASFDFDAATAGDRTLAWNREVTNANEIEEDMYHITNPKEDMDVSYTFALDMTSIEIPEQLKDIVYMLPGSDDPDASAWGFLLDLAERVSVLTTVDIKIQFDEDVNVDYSDLNVINEYFYKREASLDENTNTLIIRCGWIDQTQAIDKDTANPICILTGLKMKVKDGAAWDAEDQIQIVNTGNVGYDIYLRASSLYSFAQISENREKYNLYPFENPDVIIGGTTEKGAHFSNSYATFEDNFILDQTNRQGWYTFDDQLFYYKDNVAVTGYQKLPGHDDPDKNYVFFFDEDGVCQGKVTGIYEISGKKYYALNGVQKAGWQAITENGKVNYYYFKFGEGHALTGKQKIDGYNYEFEDYKLVKGDLVKDANGYRYRWAGTWSTQEWLEIDGKYSYTKQNGYFVTGLTRLYSPEGDWCYYAFDEDGVWLKDKSGFHVYQGETYLLDKGFVVVYPGLVFIDGYYYYFSSKDTMVKNGDYWVSKPNGLLPEARYNFDEQGRMINPPAVEPDVPSEPSDPDAPVKNGIVSENGSLYYYVNGQRVYAGLIKIGENYYYVRTSGELAVNRDYWITKTNGLLPEKSYKFDETGKIVDLPVVEPEQPDAPDTPDEPEVVKNGIVSEEGSLFYYVNGVRTYAGLIKIGEDYYYVRTSGELAVNRNYWITKTNGLLPEKSYKFDETGKIVDLPVVEPEQPDTPDTPDEPEVVKNGIVSEEGSLFYYVNGVRTYAGLIKIGEDYYYVRTSGELAVNRNYWITKTNGLLPEKSYKFDETGKIVDLPVVEPEQPDTPDTPDEPEVVKNGIVSEEGSLFYYVNGVRTYAGLIKIGEDYYYVRTSGELAHSRDYWITKTNGLLPEKSYTFDKTGKIVL